MRSCALIMAVVLAPSCGNSSKRDDAAPMPPPEKPAIRSPKVLIEGATGVQTVNVELVYTPPKIERGLMYREHLGPEAGMLFFMGSEYDWAFYMRNTLIPLDMLFITADLTVAGIVANAEPKTETLRRVGKPSLYVLEVNGGWAAAHQVVAGAKVRFEQMPPEVTEVQKQP